MRALCLVLLVALVLVEWRATVLEWRASDWLPHTGPEGAGARRTPRSAFRGPVLETSPEVGLAQGQHVDQPSAASTG